MKELFKGSWLYSLLVGTCPRCRQGSMYKTKNPYFFRSVYLMKERCSHCGLKFKIEPSFFYGAMYVSYGLGVALGVTDFIISYYFLGITLLGSFISIVIVLIALAPVIMRLSRNIWISMFINYDSSRSR